MLLESKPIEDSRFFPNTLLASFVLLKQTKFCYASTSSFFYLILSSFLYSVHRY